MADDEYTPSQTVIEQAPGRALTFLRGISQNPMIHALLAQAGYTPDDNRQGWERLLKASGYRPDQAAPAVTGSPAFDAMVALDAWDEDGFRRIRSALTRLHPEQAAFVFEGQLAASTGPSAVLGVAAIVNRLDELENGKDRKATRKSDNAALQTLAQRGIDKAERARLRELVEIAQTVDKKPTIEGNDLPTAAERRAALIDLYAWFKDWSETARAVVKKRAHLITLGLAKRKSPSRKAPTEQEASTEE
jgi:hypothetical protein